MLSTFAAFNLPSSSHGLEGRGGGGRHVGRFHRLVDRADLRPVTGVKGIGEADAVVGIDGRAHPCSAIATYTERTDIYRAHIDGVGV
jgi:hypothetical protein